MMIARIRFECIMKETILKRLLHISVFLFSATVTFAEENVVITEKFLRCLELHEDVVQNVPLRINELMQSNVDCIMDDLNEFPDSWVELYNSGTSPVSLSNYKLGLTAQADEGWQLPSQIIVEPGSFIVVYCDKVGSGLHTDFRLDPGKGSSVYLFFNGEVTDKVEDLKKQPAPNISYGRQSETAGEWGYLCEPTPGSANSGHLCTDLLGAPVFSMPGMVFTGDTPLQLQLSSSPGSPEGTVVRFTTDGSEPTADSRAYTAPITINSTTTVRAKPFCNGYLSPRSTTQSYIFLGRDMTLPVISLVTDQSYWYDDRIGILTNNDADNNNDWRRPVNIEYFESAGSESTLNQLGETRVCGNTSRAYKLKSLAIYTNKRFGTKRFDHEFFPDQRPGITDFKSLMLRNAGSDYYYLYLRDAVIQRAMATYADMDWQAWRPAVVFKNGVYSGILNIRERSNEDNVYTHYDRLEDIDMIENWWDVKEGDDRNFNRFKAFYGESGHSMDEYEQWMDCTEFCNVMLTHLYFNNLDFPGTNFMMWRPRSEGGRWRFILKDTDLGLGALSLPADYPTLNWFYSPEYDPSHSWGQNRPSATLLFRQLMEDGAFRQMFLDRATVYMGDFLNERSITAIWGSMHDLIRQEYQYHRAHLDDGRFRDYDAEQEKVRKWLSQRTDCFYQHLADFYQQGKPTAVTVNTQAEPASLADMAVTINGIPLSKPTFDGKFFVGQNITVKAECKGEQQVIGWKMMQVDSNNSLVKTESKGAEYSFVMPSCESLSLQVVMGKAAVETVADTEASSSTWHTLDGRRLTQAPAKGVFIQNGKKVIY